jgi:glycosyltransferase involved in cell wall biosynthesis
VPSITHIITGLGAGGAERALHAILTNGLEGPFRNRVISLMGLGHYGPLLKGAGIPVTCLNMRPGRPSPLALVRLLAACSEAPADIIQGWMTHGNLAATLVRATTQRPAALAWNIRWSLEGLAEAKLTTRMLTRLGLWLSDGPQAILYNSARSRQQHAAFGYQDTRAHYMPNGFDTKQWAADPVIRRSVRAEFGFQDTSRVIGFVGRGHAEKDPANLFAAFEQVAAAHPDVTLVAVGRDLDRFATASGRIILPGQRDDIPRLMQAFDVFCLSSRVEGFPNVIGEAMASGLPCVTTDVGDAANIVVDTGWVAAPRDSNALAAALNEALSLPSEALRQRGRAARVRIEQEFSIQAIVSRYAALYENLKRERP